MGKEILSRRDFLKTSLLGMASLALPKSAEAKERAPLADLPKFITHQTPVYVETLSRSGTKISQTEDYLKPEWITLTGMPLDILTPTRPQRIDVPGAHQQIAWVADVPHSTGVYPPLMHVVVGFSRDESRIESLTGSLQGKDKDIVATYVFSDRSRIYASKIYNIITALECLSEWQEENGPLTAGKVYSYIEMSGVTRRNADRFLIGGYLDAGGICASVTTMSKCVFLAGARGLTQEVARTMHKPSLRYGENPLDPAVTILNTDATVEWYPLSADYKFKLTDQAPALYFSFAADIVLNDEPKYPQSPSRHRGWPADARLTFTVSLTKAKPDYKKEQALLRTVKEKYEKFHNFNDGFLGGRTPDGVIVRP